MKKYIFIILLLCFSYSFAQKESTEPKALKIELTSNASSATFPGGMDLFYKKLTEGIDPQNIKSTEDTSAKVSFTVEMDGSLSKIKVAGGNLSFNLEVARVFKTITTKWIPGRENGKPVKSNFTLPFKYIMAD